MSERPIVFSEMFVDEEYIGMNAYKFVPLLPRCTKGDAFEIFSKPDHELALNFKGWGSIRNRFLNLRQGKGSCFDFFVGCGRFHVAPNE